jgi:DNA-binding transcriptional LysR family regulator
MKLQGVYTFVKVVERGSFAAAARELKISCPAASRHVSELESALGVQLLRRTTRRLVLSEVGRKYYERVRAAMGELAAAASQAASENADPRGVVRVKAGIGVGQHLVGPAISGFIKKFPKTTVDLTLGPSSVESLAEGSDIVIVDHRSEKASDVEYRHLAQVKYVVCASPRYLKTVGWPRNPRQLANHNCLINETRQSSFEWRFRERGKELRVRVNGSIRCNDGGALFDAVLAGAGVAHLPNYAVADAIRKEQLMVLFANVVVPSRDVLAAYTRTLYPPARLTAFVDFLQNFAKEWTHVAPQSRKLQAAAS